MRLDEGRRELADDPRLPSVKDESVSLIASSCRSGETDWTRRWRDSDSRFSSFMDDASAAMSRATSSRM